MTHAVTIVIESIQGLNMSGCRLDLSVTKSQISVKSQHVTPGEDQRVVGVLGLESIRFKPEEQSHMRPKTQ